MRKRGYPSKKEHGDFLQGIDHIFLGIDTDSAAALRIHQTHNKNWVVNKTQVLLDVNLT